MKSRNQGIVLSYLYTFLNMILGLFLSTFLLRMLGDTNYGVYQAISSFANYLILFEFGAGTVMVRNISICRGKKAPQTEIDKNISTVWTITNILNLIIMIFAVVFYSFIPRIYQSSMSLEQIADARWIFVLMSVNLIASFYTQTVNGITLGFEKYTYGTVQKLLRLILRTLILVVAITAYPNALVIAMVDALLSVGILVHSLWYTIGKLKVRITFSAFDIGIFKGMLPLCIALFLQTIINQANNNVDKFLIGVMMLPENVSLYSIALYIFSVFSSLTTIPISFYSPQIAKDLTSGIGPDAIHERLVSPCRMIVLIGGVVLFGFAAAGEQFIEIVYGEKYIVAWGITLILMLPMFFNMVNGVLINVLDVLNKRLVRSCILLGTTIANIILTIFWLRAWGIIGAALATALSTFVGQVLIMNIYYSKVLKIRVLAMFRDALKGILSFQILGAACALLIRSWIQNAIISFLVCGIVFVVVFFAGYWLFGANGEEKQLFCKILHRRK